MNKFKIKKELNSKIENDDDDDEAEIDSDYDENEEAEFDIDDEGDDDDQDDQEEEKTISNGKKAKRASNLKQVRENKKQKFWHQISQSRPKTMKFPRTAIYFRDDPKRPRNGRNCMPML